MISSSHLLPLLDKLQGYYNCHELRHILDFYGRSNSNLTRDKIAILLPEKPTHPVEQNNIIRDFLRTLGEIFTTFLTSYLSVISTRARRLPVPAFPPSTDQKSFPEARFSWIACGAKKHKLAKMGEALVFSKLRKIRVVSLLLWCWNVKLHFG